MPRPKHPTRALRAFTIVELLVAVAVLVVVVVATARIFSAASKVSFMPGFSAHADYQELLSSTGHLRATCRQAFVVHGEGPQADAYAMKMRDHGFTSVEVPSKGDRFEIT